MSTRRQIELRGVRVHNLKGVDVDLPLGRLTVISGVSGAGKSSLAFDTLYAEGQRRYIETFSTSSRQFLERLERPAADRIDHLPPAVAIRPQVGAPNRSRRATVATVTEIHDRLRILLARAGEVSCPRCGIPIRPATTDAITVLLQIQPPGTRFQIGFVSRGDGDASGAADQRMQSLRESGFTRIAINGQTRSVDDVSLDELRQRDEWEVVIDRLSVGPGGRERLVESLEIAFEHGDGECVLLVESTESAESIALDGRTWNRQVFRNDWRCSGCRRDFPPPEPKLFSFNSPLGACPACHGLGAAGDGTHCPTCAGQRLRPDALSVRFASQNVAELCELTIGDAAEFIAVWQSTNSPVTEVSLVVNQLRSRLGDLVEIGLGYLTLDRAWHTLSTGEARRLTLAAALGSNLVNTLFVIDEPTAGAHARDVERVLTAIRRLRDDRNSVVVVEHDLHVLTQADNVVDLGPGAGREGGTVMFAGPPSELANCDASATAAELRHTNSTRKRGSDGETPSLTLRVGVTANPSSRRVPRGEPLRLVGVRHNNLQNVAVAFPLGVLCVVSGVSGSGKSSLVVETLVPALCRKLERPWSGDAAGAFDELLGAEQVSDVILVDQSPIGRSSRTNAASCLGLLGDVRRLFAESAEARLRNYSAGQFSFNSSAGGRCATCAGLGTLAIDLQFLPDVSMTCPDCQGTRFRREILDVKYRGLSIAEVLGLTVREAFAFFRGQRRLQRRLKHLIDVGLEYLTLGQPADTLSGGECQRLKLAACLAKGNRSQTLFVLDEPTVGLHPADVRRLLACFDMLLEGGHSLIVIEHDLDVLAAADYVIDLGPEAGPNGGRVVAQGTPEQVALVEQSVTAPYVRGRLAVK
ncbi:MAG: excinuclease ABC subunit UvrA [Planctomycetales bacterium]|nr:excinuclease ABC subunit UvrA [Planctomycetales bacterium]